MSSPAPLVFLIVGRNEPLYSAEFGKPPGTPATALTISRQNHIVMHSALDLVDKSAWVNGNMYLKVVDSVNHQMVSTFVTACHVKFMLLHTGKSEDTIRNFFNEIYELYTKLSMNPFYKFDSHIVSKQFDTRVKASGRRYLS